MLGLARCWSDSSWVDPSRIAASLGLFAGAPADAERIGADWFFELEGPRARGRRGWKAARTPSGLPLVFFGWIDDSADLAARLGLRQTDPGTLYGAAFDAWGDKADARINGAYTAVIALPDGRLRLSRSPLGSFPLFYAADRDAAVVCSIIRPILAAGWPQRLREDVLLENLALRLMPDPQASHYEGIAQVPDGSIAWLSRDGVTLNRWYDVLSLPPTRLARDADYVEAANELLSASVRNALALAKRPAVTVSGGLDAAICVDEVLRQLPPVRRLPAYCFNVMDEWQGSVPPTNFADERLHVDAFAAAHPRLDLTMLDSRGKTFDHLAREFFLATSTGYPVMSQGIGHHSTWQAAAQGGADWLFLASGGNATISNAARWAYPEFLVTGQWRELWKIAASRAGDHRPVPRRILAMALMPLLPQRLRRAIRRMVHGRDTDARFANGLLRPELAQAAGTSIAMEPEATSQRQYLAYVKSQLGLGSELGLGFEQVFGIRGRDLTHYRPLIEFCFTIPTRQFVHAGVDRWLARRMAAGRLPEAQRMERRYGMQDVDWFLRLAPRRDELRGMVERLAEQPELAPYIDIDRARALVDNWPDEDPGLGALETDLRFVLPSTLLMGQFVEFANGRN